MAQSISMPGGSPTLTESLLQHHSPEVLAVTQANFLKAVGQGNISRKDLGFWLTQDIFYASQGYPQAVGLIASRLSPSPINVQSKTGAPSKDYEHQLRILKVLGESMINIAREVEWLKQVVDRYGFREDMVMKVAPHTQAYVDFLISTATSRSTEESLVMLWAMERLYLDAWTYAKQFRIERLNTSDENLSNATYELLENWTSEPFVKFVDELEDIVNSFGIPIDEENERYLKATSVFEHVLWLENQFWPPVQL